MRKAITTIALTAALALTAHGEYVTVKEGLRLRAEPNTNSEVIETIPFATEVTGTVKDGWMHTANGYLKASYLAEENPLDQYEYCGSWLTTAYTHSGNACFNGEYPEPNYTIAANSLPIGTEVFIENVGFRVVQDRGPASMPCEWLDLFVDSYEEAVAWGEQHHEVWIAKMP